MAAKHDAAKTEAQHNVRHASRLTRSRSPLSREQAVVLYIAVLVIVGFVAWQVREVLLLIYVSALFAVVLNPLVRWIEKLRWRHVHVGRKLAIAILIIGSILVLGGFFFFALPPALSDVGTALNQAPAQVPILLARLRTLPYVGTANAANVAAQVGSAASTVARYLFSSVPAWVEAFSKIIMGLVLTVYFMLEGDHAYAWALSLVPAGRRERLDGTLRRAEVRMGKWLLGQLILMLILGVTSTIIFWALGVRYFYLLGALMGLANIIPVGGGVVTVTLSALVAAVDSWEKMAGVLVFYLIYVQIENAWLVQRIMKTQVDLAGLAVLVALLIGASMAGIIGAIVAIPSAVLVAVLMDEYIIHKDVEAT